MLDATTKRNIDAARDVLVGKVPDPKAQVEQITTALIYKFMDDLDKESVQLGGNPKFFTGDYEKYSWSNLIDTRLTGESRLDLYVRAISSMDKNPNLPQLFRNIFKGAFLPYNDPQTLSLFLKEINKFTYDHSEELGNAFEYLLSVLGSQGDAGQFRTPRHIIDFIVAVIDPHKGDTILDPACGTAGFLISAFKHIRKNNSANYHPGGLNGIVVGETAAEMILEEKEVYTGDLLTPPEYKKLAENIQGYDISPDMVKLSLVNLYLHGFADPKIFEYDTLSSEKHWDETFDVILANPPFMTPKGGIRPHKRFQVQANRSEVLFVDYILEHLNPMGRAGIIVPEGIIFKSENAYKKLRKLLVEDGLFAVVSLPSGVFNPYSGVKTSILFFDNEIAKKTDEILFFKIEHDGFDLGAQRRKIDLNDLPIAVEILNAWKKDKKKKSDLALWIDKGKIIQNGDYNLTGDRYREENIFINHKWPIVELGEITEIISGQSPKSEFYNNKGVGTPFFQGKAEFGSVYLGEPTKWTTSITRIAEPGDILMSVRAPVGPVNLNNQEICIGRGLAAIRPSKVSGKYLFYILRAMEKKIRGNGGAVFDSINKKQISQIKIPLPSLEVQKEIVDQIENYQKVIDGAKQVVDNYKPEIRIDSKWQMMELGDIAQVTSSKRIYQKEYVQEGVPFFRTKEIVELSKNQDVGMELFISEEKYREFQEKYGVPQKGEVLVSAVGTIGISYVIPNDNEFYFKDGNLLWIRKISKVSPDYLKLYLDYYFDQNLERLIFGSAYKALTIVNLKKIKIVIPPMEEQLGIISAIEVEKKFVDANRNLIELMEKKIEKVLERI